MLVVLGEPAWCPSDAGPRLTLPACLPACLLIHLAVIGTWVERSRLVALFWPEASPEVARHNLRVNLHRLRGLLQAWPGAPMPQADRQRIRLALPTDLDRLQAACQALDPQALLALRPEAWLRGFAVPGFEDFRDWQQAHAALLQRRWGQAMEQAWRRSLEAGDGALAARLAAALAGGAGGDPDEDPTGDAAEDPAADPAEAATQTPSAGRRGDGPGPGDAALLQPGPMADAPGLGFEGTGLRSAERSGARRGPRHPLRGRDAELRALRRADARALVVIGAPGVGKSALLREALPGATFLKAHEGLAEVPYRPVRAWLQAELPRLRSLLAEPADTGLAAYRLDLARLLPELAPDVPLPALDAQTARARLIEALCRVFERWGRPLVLDDLQWCDPATLQWLAELTHRGRLPWRGSARPLAAASPCAAWLDRLKDSGLLRRIDLPPLALPGLRAACQARWPHLPWDEASCRRLHRLSGGNPMLLVELVHAWPPGLTPEAALRERGAVGEHASAARQAEAGQGLPRLREAWPLAGSRSPPERAVAMLLRRAADLEPQALALVEAAAVLDRPLPLAGLLRLLGLPIDAEAGLRALGALESALAADWLIEQGEGGSLGVACAHDLVRAAVLGRLSASRLQWLHRRAAQVLAEQAASADAADIAAHWLAAGEPAEAMPWLARSAAEARGHGDFERSQQLWRRIAREARQAAMRLEARTALAEFQLMDDLPGGCSALESVLAELDAEPAAAGLRPLRLRVLCALVENRVFAGELPRASHWIQRLKPLLRGLSVPDELRALEVQLEYSMRAPDLSAARRQAARMRQLAPDHPLTLSLDAQVAWVLGNVRAARDGFERLLALHPDHARSLTLENDLGVMCHALGDLARAEAMALRSLQSWQGRHHTEALSNLVLGAVHQSAGRPAQARHHLRLALHLARQQASQLLECEAWLRLGRVAIESGEQAELQTAIEQASQRMGGSREAMRCSQLALLRALAAIGAAEPLPPALLDELHQLAQPARHPIARVRAGLALGLRALAQGEPAEAREQARAMAEAADRAGLAEWQAWAEWLGLCAEGTAREAQALAAPGGPGAPDTRQALLALHARCRQAGFGALAQRIEAQLAAPPGAAGHRAGDGEETVARDDASEADEPDPPSDPG